MKNFDLRVEEFVLTIFMFAVLRIKIFILSFFMYMRMVFARGLVWVIELFIRKR